MVEANPEPAKRLSITFVEEGQICGRVVVDPNLAACVSFGRYPDNDLMVKSPTGLVSAHHGSIITHDGWCILYDKSSSNGLWEKDERREEIRVSEGDVISIGRPRPHARRCIIVVGAEDAYWTPIVLRNRHGVAIGRGMDNDVVIGDSTVSTRHAFLHRDEDDWIIEDLNSTNGTTVDDKRIGRAPLRLSSGAQIIFGSIFSIYACECLLVQTIKPPNG
jgi:pSer/pThr/pTyr-binding forkhead associated (FHA) protein